MGGVTTERVQELLGKDLTWGFEGEDGQVDRRDVETALRELLWFREAAKWSPIETAPRDGSTVVLYQKIEADHAYSVCRWIDAPLYQSDVIAQSGDTFVSRRVRVSDGHWDTETLWAPTHWSDLPSPPSKAQKERADERHK